MREIRMSGSMSGRWKRNDSRHRTTSRLYPLNFRSWLVSENLSRRGRCGRWCGLLRHSAAAPEVVDGGDDYEREDGAADHAADHRGGNAFHRLRADTVPP